MILTRIFPAGGESPCSIDISDPDARQRLAALYERPDAGYLRLNLISSVNGSAAGSDGTSESLTNRADRALLGVIRNQADVVLVGAASVRAEGYLVPRKTRLAIITSTGRFDGHGLGKDLEPGPGPKKKGLLVLCPASAVDTVAASLADITVEIVAVPDTDGRVDVALALDALRSRGLINVVCEGGPGLAAQLLDLGLVDEVCLSTAPVITGSRLALFGDADMVERKLELSQLLVDNASGLYARWSLGGSTASQSATSRSNRAVS